MQRLVISLLFVLAVVACLPPADRLEFDAGANPAQTGGGSAQTGGGPTGGGSADDGGDGVTDAGICDASCVGCCLNGRCLAFSEQGFYLCGTSGNLCRPCALAETCQARGCVLTNSRDGGVLGAVGAPCIDDTGCGSDGQGQCNAEFKFGMFSGWPGGYCTRDCADGGCPEGSACVPTTTNGQPSASCFASCNSPTHCREYYTCTQAPDASVCLP